MIDSGLQVLLAARESECGSARIAFAHAVAELEEARLLLDDASGDVRRLEARLNERRLAETSVDPGELHRRADFIRALEVDVLAARDVVAARQVTVHQAQRVVDEYREELARCEAAVAAAQRRRDAELTAHRDRRERAAADELDDIAIRRWHDDSD